MASGAPSVNIRRSRQNLSSSFHVSHFASSITSLSITMCEQRAMNSVMAPEALVDHLALRVLKPDSLKRLHHTFLSATTWNCEEMLIRISSFHDGQYV